MRATHELPAARPAVIEYASATLPADDRPLSLARVMLVALALRLAIAFIGIGTNDVLLWRQFGHEAWTQPFLNLWTTDPWMNHPPLTVVYAMLVYAITGEPRHGFSVGIKLPAMVGDLISIMLIARIVADRTGSARSGRMAAWMFALNPASLLLTAYHGNVDSFLAMFALLTWRFADRGKFGLAGLAAGAAINVKLAAAPAALMLLGSCRNARSFGRATLGLLVMAIPLAFMTAKLGSIFLYRTLGYRPPDPSWLMTIPLKLESNPTVGPAMTSLIALHTRTMLECTIVLILLLMVWWRRRPTIGKGDLVVLGSLFWCALVFWTGGVAQYTVWPLPLLAAANPALGLAYGIASAVWLGWAYTDFCVTTWPFQSLFTHDGPTRSQIARLLPLAVLAIAIVWQFRVLSRRPTSHRTIDA